MNCKGKNIIVTGGSEGYGYGMAKKLADRGAKVWIVGRTLEKLKKAASELGVNYVQGDVGNPADWDRIFTEVKTVDVLINNAGAGVKIAKLAESTDAEIERSISTNLTGVLLGCRRAAKAMSERKSGLIINISSVCSHYGWPGFVTYTAAKAGIDMASRALYTELRPAGVRVTVVTPSWGATNFSEAAGLGPNDPKVAGQMMSPDQMGDLIVQIVESPDNLVFPEIMVQPTVQEIIPF